MIHEAIKEAQVAYRYYKVVAPERGYDVDKAKRQFRQDRKIDKAVVKKVIDEIYKEQKEALK